MVWREWGLKSALKSDMYYLNGPLMQKKRNQMHFNFFNLYRFDVCTDSKNKK